MKQPLLLTLLFLSVSTKLFAQQINFGGTRVMHITGTRNLFIGYNTGVSISSGANNVFIGRDAGISNTSANENTFVGSDAGVSNTAGANTFLGYGGGYSNTTGDANVFVGRVAGYKNKTGESNVFIGASAGYQNIAGLSNSFIGTNAGRDNTEGNYNSFFGVSAGISNTTGINNTFFGRNSGVTNTIGQQNTLIGASASVASPNLTNAAAIGYNARVAVSNAIVLGNPDNTNLNVGIGTDSPQFPLDVRGIINLRNRGTIKFSHLRNPNLHNGSTDQFLTVNEQGETVLAHYRLMVRNAGEWSDKVFAPTYQLRPLASVAAYIGQHGHLPGIPSAAQVVREGVELGKLNATLLEKIEELTLYSIQLEKANQRQQADIDELKRLVKQALRK